MSEYVSVYETLGAKLDQKDKEISLLISRTLTAEAKLSRALKLLTGVRNQCLFSDDDGSIGITTEPHISEDLFAEMCELLPVAPPEAK